MNPLSQLIANTLATLIQSNAQFTAYDVTLLVRATGEVVRHSQVKSIVHDLMRQEGGYTSATRFFGVVTFPARVYHPVNSDVNDYNPNAIRQQISSNTANKITANQPVVNVNINAVRPVGTPISTKPSGKVVNLGSGNRIRVPADSIRKLGLKSGDKGYVSVDNGNIVITAAQPVGKNAKAFTVDQYDNLLFRSPDGAKGSAFTVAESSTQVVLQTL